VTLPIAADLSLDRDIQHILDVAIDQLEAIDVLFHNTGGPPPGLFVDLDDEAWTKAFEGILLSVVRLCRGVLPGMQTKGWGRILINTSFTVKEPAPRLILSNVFRTGVVALAKTLSREVASDGVTVNCICPGAFGTERLASIFEEQAARSGRSPSDVRRAWIADIPQGRILEPKELGDLVAFLASDRARGITGSCIPMDGGMLHGLF
jgi:3-oxoacyl-[acyl-carrier protein] reductase